MTERLKKEEKIQPIFMACGSEDFLLNENHEFRDFLEKKGVDVTYKESTGIHDWKFWNGSLTRKQKYYNVSLEQISLKR